MVVVVAILAVMVLVLAPKLLSYNERSRAEKDNSSMDEVVNAIQLALADQEIYDEVLRFSTVDNVSCYVDTNSEANYTKIVTKSNPEGIDQYTFTSDARQLDETPYFAAGNMRGVTITFAPDKGSNGSDFDLKQGVVNQYIQVSGNQRFGAMPKLYNRVRSSVGDVITNTSQTYRNSEYTVFIVMGTIGGNDESAQDATKFYGQWSGTNLPAQVSYQLVTDRVVGDTGNTIVDIDDNNWNTANGNKLTLKPGDLNGGGSYTPSTNTGNQCPHENTEIKNKTDTYTGDKCCTECGEMIESGEIIPAAEVGVIYAYLTNDDTLVLRSTPRKELNDIKKTYGALSASNYKNWSSDNSNILKVVVETPISPTNCSGWFSGMRNISEFVNLENMDVSNVTNMNEMFKYACYNTTLCLDLSHWDVSNVTKMEDMFAYAGTYTKSPLRLNLSGWNTSSVTDMSGMFQETGRYAKVPLELNLSDWNTENVTNFSFMFGETGAMATEFRIDGLSNWNTSNAINMSYMFYYTGRMASSWNIGDLSQWDTSNVINMQSMFDWACGQADVFDIGNLNYWDVSNVTNMNSMFSYAGQYAKTWNVGDLSNWKTSNVVSMIQLFQKAGQETTYWFVGDLSNWDVSNVTNMAAMFDTAGENSTSWDVGDIARWNVSNVTTMNNMFQSVGTGTSSFELDLSGWDVSKVSDMSYMFTYTGSEVDGTFELNLSGWDTTNVTTMRYMFNNAGRKASSVYIDGLSNFNTENVIDMYYMFHSLGKKASTFDIGILSNWDTANVTNMSYMFCNVGLNALYSMDLRGWNVNKVKSATGFNSNVETKILSPIWI